MWFDRLLANLAPEAALRRARARLALQGIQAAYDGARRSRRMGRLSSANGPRAEVQEGLKTLRDRSRDLVRNNAWAASALDTLIGYQIGTGITPRSAIESRVSAPTPLMKALRDDEQAKAKWLSRFQVYVESRDQVAAVNAQVDAAFEAWAARCDITGQMDFYGLQALAARTRAEAGEVLIQLIRLTPAEQRRRGLNVPLALQVLEPDLLDETYNEERRRPEDNLIANGVEYNAMGAPVAYWLFDRHPGEAATFGRGTMLRRRVPASDIIHLFKATRPGQVRGVPVAAPIITRLMALDELEDAALQQAKVQACLAAFITSDAAPGRGPLEGTDSETGDALKTFSPGMIERLLPGEDISFATPSGTGGFNELAKHQLHAIAAAYGLTYDLLTGDLSGANYSSLRAGRLAFKRQLEQDQWHLLIPGMCEPIWRAWVASALGAGALPPAQHAYPVAWAPPVFEFVDPMKDALATKAMIRMGLKTWRQAVTEQGYDPTTIAQQIADDNALQDDLGLILDADPRRANASGGAQDAAVNSAIEIAATGLAATNA
jgi:lambda family phage portal protein